MIFIFIERLYHHVIVTTENQIKLWFIKKKKGGIKSVCLRKDSHASNSLFANEMDHLETFKYSKHFQETRVPPKID